MTQRDIAIRNLLIRSRYAEGVSIARLARECQISKPRVWMILRSFGVLRNDYGVMSRKVNRSAARDVEGPRKMG